MEESAFMYRGGSRLRRSELASLLIDFLDTSVYVRFKSALKKPKKKI